MTYLSAEALDVLKARADSNRAEADRVNAALARSLRHDGGENEKAPWRDPAVVKAAP